MVIKAKYVCIFFLIKRDRLLTLTQIETKYFGRYEKRREL